MSDSELPMLKPRELIRTRNTDRNECSSKEQRYAQTTDSPTGD
jgi:hypothetical protein